MTKEEINEIETACLAFLDNEKMGKLHVVLQQKLQEASKQNPYENVEDTLNGFLDAKKVEGCSDRSLKYYRYILKSALERIGKAIQRIDTDDIRQYLNRYLESKGISKTSLDNIRRVLSSFFSWLEEEDYIMKSPMRRIHKIKEERRIKSPFSDEEVEHIKEACINPRDIAIVDVLLSTGMRVGELVRLQRSDISLDNRECLVFGKGFKERVVYFDYVTKVKLEAYLSSRDDESPYAFVG